MRIVFCQLSPLKPIYSAEHFLNSSVPLYYGNWSSLVYYSQFSVYVYRLYWILLTIGISSRWIYRSCVYLIMCILLITYSSNVLKSLRERFLQEHFWYSLPGINLFYVTKNLVNSSSKSLAITTKSLTVVTTNDSHTFFSHKFRSTLMHAYMSN